MKPVIRVENLSKQYRLGAQQPAYRSLRETIVDLASAPWLRLKKRRNGRSNNETIWALDGVSFTVSPGEVVGIIGRNGAGKSTLLKLLSRITEPTRGRIELYGRVGSLLEVGTGFHPELTGRENIYLNGAILGMRKEEIKRNFDGIVAFAEIERFVDTPVKRYSSGMYVRLAFAVAAHLEPEVLVIDEVLAVGDANFQKKCVGKMGGIATQGRTVLFVSHNMTAMQGLCSRVIWLHEGRLVADGATGQVISEYLKTSFSALTSQLWSDPATAPGNETVRLRSACVRPENGSPSDQITVKTPIVIEFEYWSLQPATLLNLTFFLINEEGAVVFATGSGNEPTWSGRPGPAGLFRSRCRIPGGLLNDGAHNVNLLVVKDQSVVIYNYTDALSFDVRDALEGRGDWYGKWPGVVRPDLEWSTELIETQCQEAVTS